MHDTFYYSSFGFSKDGLKAQCLLSAQGIALGYG